MNDSNLLVLCEEASRGSALSPKEYDACEPVFLLHNDKHLDVNEVNDNVLQYLVFSIRRKPKDLLAHLQRIMICFKHKNEAQLYAALVDFFMVLQGSGLAIKKRVLAGTRRHLSADSLQCLQTHLNSKQVLEGNVYSVLTLGTESNEELVLPITQNITALEHDPLQIAQDYIEYSQLDEARDVLETAILSTPERIELHNELLGLYQATKDVEAFNKMLLALSGIDHPMQAEWNAVNSDLNKKA